MNKHALAVVESVLKGMVRDLYQSGGMRTFFVGLHNTFTHGEVCPEVSDDDLGEIFKHFDALITISKKYE